jgi:hypothetical protein
MINTLTQDLTFFSDPSHAWLKVSKLHLEVFNIANKISSYSYMNGDDVYLEEDCDAVIYLNALKKAGINYNINEQFDDNSIIRSFNHYQY